MDPFVLVSLGVLGLSAAIRVLQGFANRRRIRRYAETNGASLVSLKRVWSWRGMFLSKGLSLYRVEALLPGWKPYVGFCKTAWRQGVTWDLKPATGVEGPAAPPTGLTRVR